MLSFCRKAREQGTGNRLFLLVLLLLLPCSLLAGPFADLDARLSADPTPEAVAGLRRLAGDDADALSALQAGPKAARAYIRLRASLEGAPTAALPPISDIKGDERIASSWLGRALSRLHMPKFDLPNNARPSLGGLGNWITTLMWAVLALLLGLSVYFLAKNVRFSKGARKAKKGIAVDEPLRSSDAWLEEANALIAEGRYREAVRGLYVAGLMRLDEAAVARFDRHQTNWEHLRRIEASPRRPAGVEARSATSLFDRCWYGHLPSTEDHATSMRDWYDGLVRALAGGEG